MSDLIDRQAAIYAVCAMACQELKPCGCDCSEVIALKELPSAEQIDLNENCTDCKEYDQERHCCPRWNRVIVQTAKELEQNRWIPVTERLPKSSEHKEEMVLICNENGSIRFDTCWNGEWVVSNPIAWMPLPEPYEEEKE